MKNKLKDLADLNPEVAAISAAHEALKNLEPEVQGSGMDYVARMLKIGAPTPDSEFPSDQQREEIAVEKLEERAPSGSKAEVGGPEGISPVAYKWMKRNGLTAAVVSTVFSIGGDEIDLIAKTIPGKSKRDRMHSVLLLKGI